VCALSFSSSIKNELCRLEISGNCCLLSELAAALRVCGLVKFTNNQQVNIKLVTENAAFARRVFIYLKKTFKAYPKVMIKKGKKLKKHASYNVVVTDSEKASFILDAVGISYNFESGRKQLDYSFDIENILKNICCKKAYLRGAFLSGGSISDPEKAYHLEIVCRDMDVTDGLNKVMEGYKLNAKTIKRKGNYVTYLKEGESIADFLNIIGAHRALMKFENIRILKDMRNNVNRMVNCETANLEKTVNASIRQIENIQFIMNTIGFGSLPENLREIAEKRMEYRDASLKELGEMLNPPLGKSGVNHRLRRLDSIADNVRKSTR
jgi:DNA-binding protein WhiA